MTTAAYPPTVLDGLPPVAATVLRLADDHLILGHRLSQWCGNAPMLEEDLSMPNMALDLLGQAIALYEYLVHMRGDDGASEHAADSKKKTLDSADSYAFLRNERDYVNCLLVEKPDEDFAYAMLKQFYFAASMLPYWQAQQHCDDRQLAKIAEKAEKEISYHLRHAGEWIVRLGDGTEDSARRMQAAIDYLHPYTAELFAMDDSHKQCVSNNWVPDLDAIQSDWQQTVDSVFERAGVVAPAVDYPLAGGRIGQHTEDFGFLLTELQYMQRAYPGESW